MIYVTCPQCSKPYQLGDDKAGRIFLCQQCGVKVTVPSPVNVDDAWSSPGNAAKPFAIQQDRVGQGPRASGSAKGVATGIGVGMALLIAALAVIYFVLVNRERNPDAEPIDRGDGTAVPHDNSFYAIGPLSPWLTQPHPFHVAG